MLLFPYISPLFPSLHVHKPILYVWKMWKKKQTEEPVVRVGELHGEESGK